MMYTIIAQREEGRNYDGDFIHHPDLQLLITEDRAKAIRWAANYLLTNFKNESKKYANSYDITFIVDGIYSGYAEIQTDIADNMDADDPKYIEICEELEMISSEASVVSQSLIIEYKKELANIAKEAQEKKLKEQAISEKQYLQSVVDEIKELCQKRNVVLVGLVRVRVFMQR